MNPVPTDSRAAGLIWLESKDDGITRYYSGWSIDEFVKMVKTGDLDSRAANVNWIVPATVTPISEAELKTLAQSLKPRSPRKATVVGRFDYVGKGRLVYGRDGRTTFTIGFGHMNGFSRRIVLEHATPDGRCE